MNFKAHKMFNPRSNYEYRIDGNIIAIVDLDLDEGKSVTNDMDNVLADIIKDVGDIMQYKIMYRDSYNTWDGIEILKPLNFSIAIKFFSINETDYNKAKEKLLAR